MFSFIALIVEDSKRLWLYCIENLINLEHLSLSNNELIGEIPSWIENLTNLTHLLLDVNEFTGIIPESICDLPNLEWGLQSKVYFGNNQFCPPYPDCLSEEVIGFNTPLNVLLNAI